MAHERAFTGRMNVDGAQIKGLTKHLRDTFKAGDEFTVIVKRKQKRQGCAAMRYYRGIVVPDIARASGITDPADYEDVHEGLAWKFLRISDHPTLGHPRRRSTSKDDMSSEELSDYISQCITYAETSIPGCRVRRADEVDLDTIPDSDWKAA